MEPDQCRLAGTVFLGAIVVTNGSKSKKKNAHKKKQGTKACTKNRWKEKNGHRGYLKRPETSRFSVAKDPSLR